MNKSLFLLIIYFFSFSIKAQEIKVNEKKHLTLLFESNIISGIVSSDDFVFEYNEDEPDNMALIKAKKSTAEETSLIVKTENGTIFNINVFYGINKKNIIQISDSLGVKSKPLSKSIDPKVSLKEKKNIESKESSASSNEKVKNSLRENDYTIGNTVINDSENKEIDCPECDKIIKSQKSIKRILDETYKVRVQLNNIYYSNNKLFFVIDIKNESDLDYNLNYIKSYVDMGNENQSTSTQYLEKNPILIYNSNRTIPGNTQRRFVFVYDQFSIDNNKKLTFEVNESNGERNLSLKIPHFLINNPRKIK